MNARSHCARDAASPPHCATPATPCWSPTSTRPWCRCCRGARRHRRGSAAARGGNRRGRCHPRGPRTRRRPLRRVPPPAPCRLAFDKSISTAVMAKNGVTTPPHQVALPHDIFRELGANALVSALGGALGFPMMVKPARSGVGTGLHQGQHPPEELPAAMVGGAYAYGPVAVVETYIEGVEVAVGGVLDTGDGPRALPAVEIRPQSGGVRLRRPVHRRCDPLPDPPGSDRRQCRCRVRRDGPARP